MKKPVILIVLFTLFLLSSNTYCQEEKHNFNIFTEQIDSFSKINLNKADSFAQKIIKNSLAEYSAVDQIDILIELAAIKTLKQQNRQSIALLFDALELCQANNLSNFELKIKSELALKHCFIGEFEIAHSLAQEVLSKLMTLSDSSMLSRIQNNLGETYSWTSATLSGEERKARKDSSKHLFHKALEYNTDTTSNGYGWSLAGLASSISMDTDTIILDVIEQKEVLYKKAITIFKDNNNKKAVASTLLRLASIFININPQKSIHQANDALKIAEDIDDNFQIQQSHRIRYLAYLNIKDYKNAFLNLKTYDSLIIQWSKTEKMAAIAELREKFETNQKDETIKQQKKDLEIKELGLTYQKRIIVLFVFGVLLLTVLSIFYYRLNKKNKAISEKNLILLKEQNHRVKNNLQIISALLELQVNRTSDGEAREVLEESKLRVDAIGLIQRRLYGENTVFINLSEFIPELVEAVIEFFENPKQKIKTTIFVEPIWLKVDKAVPTGLIINELITNSCKHAFSEHPQPEIKINIKEIRNKIAFSYADNGPGFIPEEKLENNSFGIRLIYLQTQQLGTQPKWEKNGGMTFKLDFKAI